MLHIGRKEMVRQNAFSHILNFNIFCFSFDFGLGFFSCLAHNYAKPPKLYLISLILNGSGPKKDSLAGGEALKEIQNVSLSMTPKFRFFH